MEVLEEVISDVKEIQNEKQKLAEDLANFQANVSQEMEKVASLLQTVTSESADVQSKTTERNDLLKELADVNVVLRQRGETLSKLNMKVSDLEAENNKLRIVADGCKVDQLSENENNVCLQLEELKEENLMLKTRLKDLDEGSAQDRSTHDSEILSTSTVSKAEEIRRLREVDDSFEERYNKLKALAVKLKKKSAEQAVEVATLQSDKEVVSAELTELKEKLKSLAKEREGSVKLCQNYKALQESLDVLQDELDSKKKECNQLKKDLDSVVHSGSDAKVELMETKERLTTVQKELQDVSKKYAELEESSRVNVDQLSSDINDLKSIVSKYESEIKSLKESLDVERAKVKDVEGKVEKKKASNFLELEIADYEKSVKELNKQLKEAKTTVSSLEALLNEEKSKVESLEKNLLKSVESKQKEDEVQLSLKTSITYYEEQLAELRKKLESDETEKTMLSATITQLQSQIDGLQTEIAEWAAKCEKISGSLLSIKENNHRKRRCLEERIRYLEGEKKTLESQIDHLEHEFSNYKAKAQSIIKQSSTVGAVPRHDSASEAEQERLHKAIEVLKERIEDLNTKLASSSLEYLNISEEKEKQSARDEKLLRAAELRILKLSEEIATLKGELKVSNARLQGENQALVILHQERFSTMHAEHRLIQDSLRRQIRDLEVEISSLKASKTSEVEVESIVEVQVESRREAIVPTPSLIERGQGEGSESSAISQSRFSPLDRKKERKQSDYFSLDKLLSSDLPNGDAKFEENDTSLETEIEKLKTSLSYSEKKIYHLSSLLTESEKNEVRLNSLVEALKEEIRRVRRSQERQEHAENLEYLKNIIVKFVTLPRGEEKCRLIPVLQTILRLSPEEVQSITMSVKGSEIGNKASGYLNFGIWPLPK